MRTVHRFDAYEFNTITAEFFGYPDDDYPELYIMLSSEEDKSWTPDLHDAGSIGLLMGCSTLHLYGQRSMKSLSCPLADCWYSLRDVVIYLTPTQISVKSSACSSSIVLDDNITQSSLYLYLGVAGEFRINDSENDIWMVHLEMYRNLSSVGPAGDHTTGKGKMLYINSANPPNEVSVGRLDQP